MSEVLVVEDAKFFASIIRNELQNQLDVKVHLGADMKEGVQLVSRWRRKIKLAILDLNLPDAPDGEIVDYVAQNNIPIIIFSSELNEKMRAKLLSKNVIDYVHKDSPASLAYLVSTVKRVLANEKYKVLIADDTASTRKTMVSMMRRYNFAEVFEATNGQEAWEIIQQNPDIRLVVADYNMPVLDGHELTKKIRMKFSKEQMAVIGTTTYGKFNLPPKLLKAGANDFFTKPFLDEEFFCRVSQNIEILENIETIRLNAVTDYLSGLFNRRHFFDTAPAFRAKTLKEGKIPYVVMSDIDFFKKVNDTYGHDAGDIAIKNTAVSFKKFFGEVGIAARFGGEEFCAVFAASNDEEAFERCEKMRLEVEATSFDYEGRTVAFTCSMGLSKKYDLAIEAQIADSDGGLYIAKESGRNRVILTPPEGVTHAAS